MSKEITIVQRVEELATASGIAFEFEVQELTKLSEKAKTITSTSDVDYKEVKADMVKRRNYIKSYCLDARRDIKAKAEGVSGIEKALYAIFVPEEDRLIEIAAVEKLAKEREERTLLLPTQKERIKSIGDEFIGDLEEDYDEFLLSMDGAAFETYYNARLTLKNEADRAEIARKQAAIAEKEQSLLQEEKTKEREETARKEGAAKAKQDAKDKADRDAKKKEADELKANEEKEAAAEAEAEAKRKLEASKKFQSWLKEQGYSEETKADFKIVDNGDSVTLYKILGNYKK